MKTDLVAIPFSGRSMDPLFKNVDTVWVDFSKKESPNLGDVLLYRDLSQEWVCHRFIFADDAGYWLKGDSNTTADCLKSNRMFGRVRAIQRGAQRAEISTTHLTRFICFLQKKQILASSFLEKKIYRSFVKFLLILEATLSN